MQLSGKYDLIETLRTTDGDDENKLKQTSSETDFNPVLHRASVNKVNYICDDVQQSVKHLKRGSNNVSATNSESIEATIEMNPHKQQHAKKLNNCKSTAQACSMQRLKRKRRLFDSDNCSSKINDKTTKVTEQVGTNLIENASCSEPVSSVIEKEDTELTARLSSCSDNQKQSNSDQTGMPFPKEFFVAIFVVRFLQSFGCELIIKYSRFQNLVAFALTKLH